MNGCSFIVQVVPNLYLNPVTPVCLDGRSWELAVDYNDTSSNPIWCQLLSAYAKVIVTSNTCRELASAGILDLNRRIGEGKHIPV